jgi:hypothetical protein
LLIEKREIKYKEEDLTYKDIDLFKLRPEGKIWQKMHEKEKQFIMSTRQHKSFMIYLRTIIFYIKYNFTEIYMILILKI